MTRPTPLALLALLLAAAGACHSGETPQRAEIHRWMIDSYNDDSVAQALITQHTLFPYDFVDDAPVLNELGDQHLQVLARHFRDYPGPLNVRQGDTPQALYLQRVAAVRTALAQAGVRAERVAISDGFAGGDGATSERVLTILAAEKAAGASSGGQSGYGSAGATMQPAPISQGNQP